MARRNLEPSVQEAFMSTWQESRVALIALIAALFAGFTGTTFAATTIYDTAVTPSQKQETPPDCKRNPEDPRCKKTPY
jgi:hypothetical protein